MPPPPKVIIANPVPPAPPTSSAQGTLSNIFNGMFGLWRRIWPTGPLAGEYGISASAPVLSPFTANPAEEPDPKKRPQQTTAALGGSGTPIYAGFVTDLGEYNGKLQGRSGFDTYEKMRRSDPDCRAALQATKLPIRCAQYDIIPGVTAASPLHALATEIADFVKENIFGGLETMSSTGFYHTQSYESVLENALLNLDFGCSCHEILWHVDGNKVKIRRLAPRLPLTFYRFYPDTDGETLLAMEQYGYRGQDYISAILPAEKIDYFTYDKEGADFYGRAIGLNEPIPTPYGWRRMGDLDVGDSVFDDAGGPTKVVARSQIWKSRPCYRVVFGDWTSILVDANHQWAVQSYQERKHNKSARIRTTEEMSRDVLVRSDTRKNYTIARCGPLQYKPKSLPIDPYVAGLWMGNGNSNNGVLTFHEADVNEFAGRVKSSGFKVQHRSRGEKDGQTARFNALPLTTLIRESGLQRNKHIPDVYQRGSISQRQALLAGLMDSDGSVNDIGQCFFTNTNERLVDGIVEILRSLGEAPTSTRIEPTRENEQVCWMVSFFPLKSPFRLARKTATFNSSLGRRTCNHWKHYIRAIEPVEPQDTVCIEVDSPSHLFLAGESCVPTHNSALRPAYAPWFIKSNLYRLDSIAIERNGMGIPIITLAENADDDDKAFAQRFVTMVATHEQTGLTIPFGYDFKLAGMTGRIRDPKTSIQHHPLPLYTPIPTPKGFVTILNLKVGDKVFDEEGKIQRVLAKTPIYKQRPCYRLNFSDDTSLIADGDHKWLTTTFKERNRRGDKPERGAIRTTVEIYQTQCIRNGGGRTTSNHAIAACGPVEYPRQKLPIDPYTLGVWLGNGNNHSGHICGSIDDINEEMIHIGGAEPSAHNHPIGRKVDAQMLHVDGLTTRLRDLGLLRNKHVPEIYFRSSIEQRRALLAGLMDTDGYVDKSNGTVGFTNTRQVLVDAVIDLARSLGELVVGSGPYTYRYVYKGQNKECTYWAAKFVPAACPFRLARKAEVVKARDSKLSRKRHRRYIVSVEPVAPRDTMCITVSGKSHLFLAGTAYVPTSNSEQILRAFLAQFLAFGTTATGSRSLSQDMTTFFKLGLNAITRGVTSTITGSSIRRLVDFNYGDSRKGPLPYPRLVHSNIAALDPMELADKIKSLAQWQTDLVQPDDELENWFRTEYGLPPKSKMRPRWMPVQTRLMEQPAPGLTQTEIEAGKDPEHPGAVIEPMNPNAGVLPPHPGTPAKGLTYTPGSEPSPHRSESAPTEPIEPDPASKVKATETVEAMVLLADSNKGVAKRICWDFDGVISIQPGKEQMQFQAGKFGELSQNAKVLMEKLAAAGFTNVVVTARQDIAATKAKIEEWKLPVESVGNKKLPCLAYVDDRGINIEWSTDFDEAAVARVLKALKKIAKSHGEE